jgi:glycosyltransferase involved in cell wall biosynthesis
LPSIFASLRKSCPSRLAGRVVYGTPLRDRVTRHDYIERALSPATRRRARPRRLLRVSGQVAREEAHPAAVVATLGSIDPSDMPFASYNITNQRSEPRLAEPTATLNPRPRRSGVPLMSAKRAIIFARDKETRLTQTRLPPRLVHLADYGGAYSGSFIPMLLAVARSARETGWSVELIFSDLSRDQGWLADIEQARIPYRFLEVQRVRLSRWSSWIFAEATHGYWQGLMTKAISALLKEAAGPTILHTHFAAFDVAAAHAARKAPHASVIWHGHSMRRPGWKPTVGGLITYRVFARNVGRFLCVSPDVDEAIGRLAPRDRVTFVPNAVDPQLFAPPTAEQRARARVKLGIPHDVPVLLHFGSHWLRKGGDIYLETVRSLQRTPGCSNVHAITVGKGDARVAVDAADLRSVVTVLEPTEEVRDLYRASDVLVSPSRSEGMPLAILEALAMGLPVVASDIPGQAFVGKAIPACRLTSLRSEDLADSICGVLGLEPNERAQEQAVAHRWIREHMSLESWVQTLMQIYKRLLPTPTSPTGST